MANVLPPNTTRTEHALEDLFSRIEEIPIPTDTLWSSENCPESILPWLAWAVSVDLWDSHWSEERKRAFIANSLNVHRQKGTIASIRGVLDNLGVSAVIREWFDEQLTPPFVSEPHHFSLTASVTDDNGNSSTFIDAQTYRDLIRAIEQTKPVRSHFDFRVSIEGSYTLTHAAAFQHVIYIRREMTLQNDVNTQSQLSLPTSTKLIQYIRIDN